MSGALAPKQKVKKGRPLQGYKNQPPTVTITALNTNPTENVPTPGYSAVAEDAEQGNVSNNILWRIGGSPGGTVLGQGGDVTLTFPSPPGPVALSAEITDTFGVTVTDDVTVTVLSAEA